ERLVDVLKAHGVGNKRIKADIAAHRLLDHAGQLAAAFHATKGRAAPDAAGDQLERARADFLAGAGDADNDAFAPALVAALECGAQHVHIADAFKTEIDAAVGHGNDHFLDRFVVVLRVDEIGGAHLFRQREFVRVGVDGDDAPGFRLHGALYDGEANAAEAEHGDGVAFLHFRGVVHRPDAGGDAAAQQADFFMRRVGIDFGERHFGDDGVFAEGAGAHVVVDGFAVVGEARGAVGHQALALGFAHGTAQVGLAGFAEFALAAFGGVERNHMVARLDAGDAFADFDDDAGAFMTKHGGEHAFRVVAAQGKGIGVAHA